MVSGGRGWGGGALGAGRRTAAPTFGAQAERHALDVLQLGAGAGQHLQLHRGERGRPHT